MHRRLLRTALTAALVAGMSSLVAPLPAGSADAPPAESGRPVTAWQDGAFQVDTEGLVSRSDLVLEQAPWRDFESMPVGNGHLGTAVWAENGFTAQLNRNDTFPHLKSAGQLVIPGLFDLSAADDYTGRLDMYDGQLHQSGGGLDAVTYVRADADQFVVDVTGADPDETQTVELRLWEGRTPQAHADGGVVALAETFTDELSGITTGAVAAVTALGRDVTAEVVDDLTVRLTFRPNDDGSFRVVTGVPAFTGGDVAAAAAQAVAGADADDLETSHLAWWSDFWAGVAPMRVSSDDGVAEYMENLRLQQLYTTAATQRAEVPTGQAGAANMLYPFEDRTISPDFYFHYNLRQQVFANFGAGTAEFNDAYLSLYIDRLPQMLDWTRDNWPGTEGVCVSELLRFDGSGGACDGTIGPAFLNRVISTGPEVAHDIWKQYEFTGDEAVLEEGYPLMREVVRFHLSLLEEGEDGRVHLHNVNSMETQWDTTDPTTDVAAMRVMFPIVADLAEQNGDAELAAELQATIPKLPEFTTTTRNGVEVMAWSATDEPAKNTQNVDLEPLAWGVYGIESQLMRDTFEQRVFPLTREWDESPISAARLGLPDDMLDLLVEGTVDLQKFPNGFSGHGKNDDPASINNYYSSWNAIVASSLQESLVQAHQDVVRIAPSWVEDWDVDGTVAIPGGHRVSTQVRDGVPNLVGIEAGSDDTLRIANPWPGERIRVVDGTDPGGSLVRPTDAEEIELDVEAGASYVVERAGAPLRSFGFEQIGGEEATEARRLGDQTLGIESSTPEIRSDVVDVVAPGYLDRMVRATEGVDHLLESSDVIDDLPDELDGTAMVRGEPEDAENAEPDDYLTLDLEQSADVYVALDERGDGVWWPDWLEEQGFTRTDLTVGTHDFLQSIALEPDGRLRAASSNTTLLKEGSDWGDQILEVTMQQVQVGTSVMFRAQDARNGYVWQIGGSLGSDGGLGQLQMYRMVDGSLTRIGHVNPIVPGARNQYDLRVEAIGDEIRTFIDGELVAELQDDTFAAGRAGIRMAGSEVGEFDRFTVTTPEGETLFDDDFTGDLSAWDVPAERENVSLVVWKKQFPAGQVALGPNSGVDGQGEVPYVTFVDESAQE